MLTISTRRDEIVKATDTHITPGGLVRELDVLASDADVLVRNEGTIGIGLDPGGNVDGLIVDLAGAAHTVTFRNFGFATGDVRESESDPDDWSFYSHQYGYPAVVCLADDAEPESAFVVSNRGRLYAAFDYDSDGSSSSLFPSTVIVSDAPLNKIWNAGEIDGSLVLENRSLISNDGRIDGDIALGDGGNVVWNDGEIGSDESHDGYSDSYESYTIFTGGNGVDVIRNGATGIVDAYFVDLGGGDDRIENSGRLTRVWLGEGDDGYVASGAGSAPDVGGGTGDDTLRGADGDDRLHGDLGRDVLFGGAGDDTLFGGSGADRFILDEDSDLDIVRGFSHRQNDKLDLRAFDLDGFGDHDLVVVRTAEGTEVSVGDAVFRLVGTGSATAHDFLF